MTQQSNISIELLDIFKSGTLGIIALGEDSITEVTEKLGPKDDEDENSNQGTFLYWKNLRVYFNDNGISEYADLKIINSNLTFGRFPCNPFGEYIVIEEEIDFKKLIKFLNINNINFEIKNSITDWDIIKICVSKNIEIIIRMEDDFILDRITFKK